MTFAWPFVLSLLLLPLAAVWLRRRPAGGGDEAGRPGILRGRVEKQGIRISDTPEGAAPSRSGQPRLWLGLALLIIALARPQWGVVEVPTYSKAREILVAIDLSRSMLAVDIVPSRLERARLLTRGLLDALQGDRVGLVVFAGTSFLQCPLSADYEILREFLPALSPDFLPEGGSNYDALLETALASYSQEGAAERFLIILSDGEATDDFWRERIPELKKRGIRVIGLGVGTAAGSMIPQKEGGFVKDKLGAVVLSKLESGTLRSLSEATGGVYRDASTWVDLAELVRTTVEQGDAAKTLESSREKREERFSWFLAPGLLFLLWSLWREFPRSLQPRDLPVLKAAPLVALVWWVLPPTEARAQITPPPGRPAPAVQAAAPAQGSEAAPLVALSKDLAGRTDVAPREWARYAQATLDYARRRAGAGGEVSIQALRDGLAAVAEGEALDPKAADWPDLRRQLEVFLKPSPTPTPPPRPSPSPTPTPQPSGSPPPTPSPSQGGTPPPQAQGQPSPNPDSGSQGTPPPSQGKPNGTPPPRDQNRNENQKAFDPAGTPPPAGAPSPSPQRQEKQKVGGQSIHRGTPTPSSSPQLSAAQQKLDQVRTDDNPAELQELLRGDTKPNAKPEKDW